MRASTLLTHIIRKHAAASGGVAIPPKPQTPIERLINVDKFKDLIGGFLPKKPAPVQMPLTAPTAQPALPKTAADVKTPFYEDPSVVGAAGGAALGGGAGALLSKKNKWRNALLAALAGGAAGYVAGPHVDKAVPQIRQGLGALSGAGAKDVAKTAAASRADFDGNAVGTSPDFLQALGAKMAPSSATKPAVLPKAAPAKVVGKKTAQEAAPTIPFYKDPANIGAVTGAALAGGGAALLSKKNKWRNALIAALAGGTAGYFAGPHVDKAFPQIREGLGKVGDMISPPAKATPPPAKPVAAETPPPVTPQAPQSATAPEVDLSALGTLAPPKYDV